MLNAELTLKKSCLEIRVINQLTSELSTLVVVTAVSGYTGLWAGGSRHRGNNRVGVRLGSWNRGVRGLALLKALM